MEKQKNAWLKILSGCLLLLSASASFLVGRNAQSRVKRVSLFILSGALLIPGIYFFISGVSDVAIGKIGSYKIGQAYIQPMIYESKEAFKKAITANLVQQPNLRRLSFECPDKSNGFRVYLTPLKVFNIPMQSIVCNDGFKLLTLAK